MNEKNTNTTSQTKQSEEPYHAVFVDGWPAFRRSGMFRGAAGARLVVRRPGTSTAVLLIVTAIHTMTVDGVLTQKVFAMPASSRFKGVQE